ncbi:TetR/AcrR family transcriptional regulator [Aureimonas leprariae]|uniref:TetR/AcrR family transcriptional regulator n=1 Tax=Plantimonas leprariae TaxID=2615207 RepID=A0A7V7PS83_9HYPH|nr:TetR/AcrR family transcriptional regulator C-terminal domain-containing protein [Aureimonas leprariae]KAB0681920.1 TetR/AcrR family transcriptional regulator [Aureimonas leprariae]
MSARVGEEADGGEPNARQRDVLDAALSLLVEGRVALTMASVADRASCSKETLYKWFGGRDGLLTATVRWQAAKVRAVPVPAEGFDAGSLRESLGHFARDWLETITGVTSVALNRLAIGEASDAAGTLGRIVLNNGPLAMRHRLMPVLEAGRSAGLIRFDDGENAFRTFFGLVVGDLQIRLLLGEAAVAARRTIAEDAARAVDQFLALHEPGRPAAMPRGIGPETAQQRKET